MVRPPRKGGDQAYLGICGATVASAVIRALFGVDPPVAGGRAADLLRNPEIPRGVAGVLRNVPYGGHLYDVASGPAGLSLAPAAAV